MTEIMKPLRATNHCRHYDYERGVGPRCACAVDLTGPGDAQKCMPANVTLDRSAEQPEPCDWREEYTPEERAAWSDWMEGRKLRMISCMALIPGNSRDRKAKPFWGQSGRFDCPACKTGMVKWTRARINGHVWAACSTPDCFEVME